jgi:hypothetical protein
VQRVREEVTETRAAAAVAQDIMLVPRTVYVPYAPQVPIAPVRLAGLTSTTTQTVTGQRREITTAEQRQETRAALAEGEVTNLARDLLSVVRSLNDRLDRVEQTQRDRLGAPSPRGGQPQPRDEAPGRREGAPGTQPCPTPPCPASLDGPRP